MIQTKPSYHIKRRITALRVICVLVITSVAISVSQAQQQIPPEVIAQFQALSPAEQLALAEQLGVDFEQLGLGGAGISTSTLGQPQDPLQPFSSTMDDTLARFLQAQEELLEEEEESGEPRRYGLDLFDADITTFTPVDDALVPDEYKLGPGDELNIQLFGKENDQYSLVVTREGEVNFPRFGPISVAGLSFEDTEALIQRRVEEQLIGVEAVVSLGRLRAISVFMAGEVARPGSYAVSALATVTQALFVAGGVSEIGSLRNIEVKRSGETVGSFDLYDLLIRGDVSGDIRLRSGDVIFVPPYSGIAEVAGAVRRPLLYEVRETETINDLISMAGGFNNTAYISSVILERNSAGAQLSELRNLDLSNAQDLAMLITDGDLIRVPESAEFYGNQITIEGAVVRPGSYAWYEGIRVSDLLRSIDVDLLQEADLNYSLIVRQKNALRDIEVQHFGLSDALQNKGSTKDPLLNRQDKILVFGLADEELLQEEIEEEAAAEEEAEAEAEAEQRNLALLLGIDTEEDEEEEEEPTFRRQELLEPVLAKLRIQAREGQPVQIVSVSGAVKVAGDYPLKQGDRLFDLVRAAGGLNDSAYLTAAELRRVSEFSGEVKSEFNEVSITEFGEDTSVENFELQSRDHLTIREIPDWSPQNSITISGEVRFPGTYLFGNGETLGDVLQRAGGLTEDGFAAGAQFTREIIREREVAQARAYAREIETSYASATLTREELQSSFPEIQQISERLEEYEGLGRMIIDLEAVLMGDTQSDVALLHGDELYIPQNSDSVAVIGEVQRASTHGYQSNFDLYDYLELSAGSTRRADKDNIYIVKANGSVVYPEKTRLLAFSARNSRIRPGDTIVVPINTEYRDRFNFWTSVTQILFQSGIAVATVLAI